MSSASLLTDDAVFKQISNLNKDFIYIKNIHSEVVFANRAILSLFPEHSYQDVLKNKVLPFFEAHSERPVAELERIALEQGEHQRVDHVQLDEDSYMVLQTTIQRFEHFREDAHLLVVSRDVTEREVIIKDLRRSNKDLDNFAYVASHDLKAPLNVIKRLVTWVMEDCATLLPQDSKENLELVLSRAHRMEQLLKDLLAYSRIGKEYQAPTQVNVKDKVIELLSLIDLPMGFSLNCDDETITVPEVPFSVILLNLIANAIKHHDLGNANIQIKVRRNQKSSVVTVMDNGPGIEPENRARIFELFETLKPRDEVEGSGMGLSVVKRLIEHYGGYIKVEENKPRGAKFVVYWPMNNLARQVLNQLND